ncbi:MAG: thioredoxin [Anaerolineales bacterium]|nr:thioredoxin [Anaerolineales bacterium]
MAEIVELSEATFETEVVETGGIVLVDFGAEWCHPCKQLDPIVEELAEEWRESVKVGKVDIDANVDIAMKYGVMGVPTLILFKEGIPVERMTGFVPKRRILDKFSPHIS